MYHLRLPPACALFSRLAVPFHWPACSGRMRPRLDHLSRSPQSIHHVDHGGALGEYEIPPSGRLEFLVLAATTNGDRYARLRIFCWPDYVLRRYRACLCVYALLIDQNAKIDRFRRLRANSSCRKSACFTPRWNNPLPGQLRSGSPSCATSVEAGLRPATTIGEVAIVRRPRNYSPPLPAWSPASPRGVPRHRAVGTREGCYVLPQCHPVRAESLLTIQICQGD